MLLTTLLEIIIYHDQPSSINVHVHYIWCSYVAIYHCSYAIIVKGIDSHVSLYSRLVWLFGELHIVYKCYDNGSMDTAIASSTNVSPTMDYCTSYY